LLLSLCCFLFEGFIFNEEPLVGKVKLFLIVVIIDYFVLFRNFKVFQDSGSIPNIIFLPVNVNVEIS
jgi:hypothetical protein